MALVPGGRLIINVGDVCRSRRSNNGRHTVVPLHATIQDHCKAIGFDNLTPIIWHKIANANYEVSGGGGFLGKPYEPNSVIENDVECVHAGARSGGYRSPTARERLLSIIGADNYQAWFRQIWSDLPGTSSRHHPAPYPVEFAERTWCGCSPLSATTCSIPSWAPARPISPAHRWGRNSVGIELDAKYYDVARRGVAAHGADLFVSSCLTTRVHDHARFHVA